MGLPSFYIPKELPYSSNTYPIVSSVGPFTIPFEYISKTDVRVSLNGTNLVYLTDFTFDSQYVLRLVGNRTGLINIYRVTERATRLVDFQDAAVLTEDDLDTANKQALFVSLESIDTALEAQALAASLAGSVGSAAAALAAANTAVTTANAIAGVAATANANAAAAVATANGIAATASSALSTANAANTTASTANTNANTALSTANGIAGNAATALSVANSTAAIVGAAPVVAGSFKNLAVSATGLSSPILVTADALVLDNGAGGYRTITGVNVSPSGSVVGAANGLDVGPLATNTWYSIWVIWDGTTAAGLLSTSTSSPTLPSGYTHKARVGWAKTDSTANKYPLSFMQYGRNVSYKVGASTNVPANVAFMAGVQGNLSVPTFVAVTVLGVTVPMTACVVRVGATSNNSTVGIAPNASYGSNVSVSLRPPVFAGFNASAAHIQGPIFLESSSLYVYSDDVNNRGFILGWEDNL